MKPIKFAAVSTVSYLCAGSLLLGQMNVPQLGTVRYPDGSVHLVRGISGNLIVDPHTLATASSASFSDSGGLLAVDGAIRLLRADGSVLGEYPAGEPVPKLHIDSSAQSSAVWLPSKHLLVRWDGAKFIETAVDDSAFGGPVTFVNLTSSGTAQFFVTRADFSVARISVALPAGRVTSSDTQPAARGWVFVQQGWCISQDEWGLTAERGNGRRQTIQLSQQTMPVNDLQVEQMSDHWLHVSSRSTGTGWALYTDATKLSIFLLPPPAPETHQ